MKKYFGFVAFSLIFFTSAASALRFSIPPQGSDLVGHAQFAIVNEEDTFSAIAQRYDVGYFELVEANPGVNPDKLLPGTVLLIPTQYVLPQVPKKGIVINLAAMRLYFFPEGKNYFYTYPVGIGRVNWSTPLGKFRIIQKIKNPVWMVPDSIFRYRQEQGDPVPKRVPSGPDNPLGYYALRLSNPTYLIHGTNEPESVGRRSSAGCIHLYNDDVESLFSMVLMNTAVRIINQPYLVGRTDRKVYIEAHLPLKEQRDALSLLNASDKVKLQVNEFLKENNGEQSYIGWEKIDEILDEHIGIPILIGCNNRLGPYCEDNEIILKN